MLGSSCSACCRRNCTNADLQKYWSDFRAKTFTVEISGDIPTLPAATISPSQALADIVPYYWNYQSTSLVSGYKPSALGLAATTSINGMHTLALDLANTSYYNDTRAGTITLQKTTQDYKITVTVRVKLGLATFLPNSTCTMDVKLSVETYDRQSYFYLPDAGVTGTVSTCSSEGVSAYVVGPSNSPTSVVVFETDYNTQFRVPVFFDPVLDKQVQFTGFWDSDLSPSSATYLQSVSYYSNLNALFPVNLSDDGFTWDQGTSPLIAKGGLLREWKTTSIPSNVKQVSFSTLKILSRYTNGTPSNWVPQVTYGSASKWLDQEVVAADKNFYATVVCQ